MIDYKGFKINYWGYRGYQVESPKKIYNEIFHSDGAAMRFIDQLLRKQQK